ncbi:MAG: single-stranded-DNA-specific exonuclease RecJ [Verrucomicrobia bacterium]|nr:MAG: single-stranded-DNA-specific exonuclease RecJ [Verrucomicrobiota bacterium]
MKFLSVFIRVHPWLTNRGKMKYRWQLRPPQPLLAGQLARELRLSALFAQCLLNRGLDEPVAIRGFLDPRLKLLADPFLLPNMARAVERLWRAREQDEPFVIFGDYDVDGVTSTALLLEVFGRLGWRAQSYLPHRMDEGYGLSQEAVENCLKRFPVTLLLAVDCASTTVNSIAWLKDRGVDVIVLDHHQVSRPAPEAVALVNPQVAIMSDRSDQSNKTPPFTELCSVGLAFKLAHALVKRGRESGLTDATDFDLRPLLDLVALGTIADLVPLTGENRILVSAGLKRLNDTKRPGLLALKQVAQCLVPLGAYEVGFQLAPRLNAAGRMETAQDALTLLLAQSQADALPLAQKLDNRNRDRQTIERTILEEALGFVHARFKEQDDFVIVEGQSPWHIGVLGIVAARMVQQFYRPAIIVGGDSEEWRGSGRSIAGFDLAAALRECGDLLVRHGGHAMAAGLSIRATNLDPFRSRLGQIARRSLKPDDLQPALRLDAEVGLEEITLALLTQLDGLKPTGQHNPPVHFVARGLTHQRPLQRIGAEKQHVKMWVANGLGALEAVWWRGGNESLPVGRFDLAFSPQVNEYNGRRAVQLKVLDWQAAERPLTTEH